MCVRVWGLVLGPIRTVEVGARVEALTTLKVLKVQVLQEKPRDYYVDDDVYDCTVIARVLGVRVIGRRSTRDRRRKHRAAPRTWRRPGSRFG